MEKILLTAVQVIFGIAGLALIIVPPKHLLSLDRRTGYWIYKRTLDATGDEHKAVRAAGVFYKIFGIIFIVFSGLFPSG